VSGVSAGGGEGGRVSEGERGGKSDVGWGLNPNP